MIFKEFDFNNLYKNLVTYVLKKGHTILIREEESIECINCLITLKDIDNDYIDFSNTQAFERQGKYENYKREEIKWYESGCRVAEHAPAELWRKLLVKTVGFNQIMDF